MIALIARDGPNHAGRPHKALASVCDGWRVLGWPAILGREEEKARALLVAVTPNESTRVRQCYGVGLRHAGTLLAFR
jgi:hypothetical protein